MGKLHVYVVDNKIPKESVDKLLEEYEVNPMNRVTMQCASLNQFEVVTPEPVNKLTKEELGTIHELDTNLISIAHSGEFLDQGCYNPAHEQCYASRKDCVVIDVQYFQYKNVEVHKLTLAE